ncbi:MAG: protein phosphatase 2C domain-containing protein [Anaerolineae bacterium]|nr:protein phosphatase 2C domain-containing protein [Anaerolineae bacterium]
MNCPTCGTDNRDGARFCRRCGAELAEAPAPAADCGADLSNSTPPEPALPETPDLIETPAEPGEPVPDETPPGPKETTPAETSPEAGPVPPKAVIEEAEAAPDQGEAPGVSGVDTPPIPPEQAEAPDETASPPAVEPEPGEEVVPEPDAFWREDAVTLQPAPAGTVIDGRYALGDVLDMQSDRILYQARDLQRCWQCGFDGNAPSEAFCARCGAALERKPEVRILEVGDAEAESIDGERVVARLVHDGRAFLVLAEPEPPPQPAQAPGAVRLLVGQRSVPGQVRELNEDSLLILTLASVFQSQTGSAISLFAVADGMGGHEGGEIASKLALQVMAEGIVHDIILPSLVGQAIPDDGILSRLRQAVVAANDAVYLTRQKRGTDMGTTLTILLIRDQQLFLAHVGDCRAFRWDASGLVQLTVDHSLVATMVARGQITADEIYTNPQRSIVYRSIGDRPTAEVDTGMWALAPGDRLIVCSDGLWEMLHNEGIQDGMMAEADPQAACDLLVNRANAAGGDDNISVIVVEIKT